MATSISILIADDDIGTAGVLAGVLEGSGYTVELAAGGPEALARFKARPFDVVFLDLRMPGMNGLEVFRRMRPTARVPTILMTAYPLAHEMAEAAREGFVALLAKPLPLEPLLEFVAALAAGWTILLLESDPALAGTLRGALEAAGHRVTWASDGATALRAAESESFALAILDLGAGPGPEVLRGIRALRPSLPLLAFGHGAQGDGAADYDVPAGADWMLGPVEAGKVLYRVRMAQARAAAKRFLPPGANATPPPTAP